MFGREPNNPNINQQILLRSDRSTEEFQAQNSTNGRSGIATTHDEMFLELEAGHHVQNVWHLLVHNPLLVAGRALAREEVLPQGLELPAHQGLILVADVVVADCQLLPLEDRKDNLNRMCEVYPINRLNIHFIRLPTLLTGQKGAMTCFNLLMPSRSCY